MDIAIDDPGCSMAANRSAPVRMQILKTRSSAELGGITRWASPPPNVSLRQVAVLLFCMWSALAAMWPFLGEDDGSRRPREVKMHER